MIGKRGITRRILCCVLALAVSGAVAGCSTEKDSVEKVKDLDFTIVAEEDIPQEFLGAIEEKKQNPMKLSFLDTGNLYIAVGYGVQKSTGYSVGVEELYLTENSIYIDTTLIGPAQGEAVTQTETWPYVVVKTERREEPVVFE